MASTTFLFLIFSLLISLFFFSGVSADQQLNSALLNETEGGINNTWKSYGWCELNEAVSFEKNRKILLQLLNISPNISQSEIVYDQQDVCHVLEDKSLPGGGRHVNIDSVHQGRVLIDGDSMMGDETKGHSEEEIDTEHPPDKGTQLTIHIYDHPRAMEASEFYETGIYPVSYEDWQDLASSICTVWTTVYFEGTDEFIRVYDPNECWEGFETHFREYMGNGTYHEFDLRTSSWTEVRRRLNRIDAWPVLIQGYDDIEIGEEGEYGNLDDVMKERYEEIMLIHEQTMKTDKDAFVNEQEATTTESFTIPDSYFLWDRLATNKTRQTMEADIWEDLDPSFRDFF